MSTAELIAVVVVAIILFYLTNALYLFVTKLNSVSKYAMTLLLDEFFYQRERTHFIKLVESIKTDYPNAIFDVAMLDLEGHAKQNAISKAISLRMWQLNKKAAETGKSAVDLGQEDVSSVGVQIGKKAVEPYPNRDVNLRTGQMLARFVWMSPD
jgi:hypothetical protein